jgi:hypothetical protein
LNLIFGFELPLEVEPNSKLKPDFKHLQTSIYKRAQSRVAKKKQKQNKQNSSLCSLGAFLDSSRNAARTAEAEGAKPTMRTTRSASSPRTTAERV